MGATNQLAEFVVNTRYEDFPEETVKVAKDFILDCQGVMIGGSQERVSQIAIRYIRDGGGVPECGVFGGGFQTSLTNAVFINGTSAHAQELEVEVPTFIVQILRFPDPKNGEEAKFSLHQSLGAALIDRKVPHPYIQPFSDAGAVDPRYQEARRMINVITRTDWSGGRSAPWSMPVTVTLKDGRKFTKAVDQIKAGPGNPLSKEELADRYRALVQGFLSAEQTECSMDLVFNLEKLEAPLELVKLATFGRSA